MLITEHPAYSLVMTKVNNFITVMTEAQARYFLEHGRFFQGLALVNGTPDGVTELSAEVTRKPSDQNETWADLDSQLFKQNLKVPFQVTCNTHRFPTCHVWSANFEIWYMDAPLTDIYGESGNHIMYRHYDGDIQPSGNFGVWYVVPNYQGQ